MNMAKVKTTFWEILKLWTREWEYICNMYWINIYGIRDWLIQANKEIDIELEDAYFIWLLKEEEEKENREKVIFESNWYNEKSDFEYIIEYIKLSKENGFEFENNFEIQNNTISLSENKIYTIKHYSDYHIKVLYNNNSIIYYNLYEILNSKEFLTWICNHIRENKIKEFWGNLNDFYIDDCINIIWDIQSRYIREWKITEFIKKLYKTW